MGIFPLTIDIPIKIPGVSLNISPTKFLTYRSCSVLPYESALISLLKFSN